MLGNGYGMMEVGIGCDSVRESQFSKVSGRKVVAYRGIEFIEYRGLRRGFAEKGLRTAVS